MTDRIKALENITDPDFIFDALDDVHDAETTLADYAAAVSRAQREALAASQGKPDAQELVSFLENDVRHYISTWQGEYACNDEDHAKVERDEQMLGKVIAALAANQPAPTAYRAVPTFTSGRASDTAPVGQPAQPVAVKVKPLEWGPYPNPVFAGPDISVANVSGAVISYYYQAGRDPDAPGYYVFAAPTHGTLQWRSAGYASIEAAKAAAQADYEARIMAALDVQPLTVQDAARKLLDAEQEVADAAWFKGMTQTAFRSVLRAIAEGRA